MKYKSLQSFSNFGAKAWNTILTNLKQLKYNNFKRKETLDEIFMQIVKDQDEYLESLTILEHLNFF